METRKKGNLPGKLLLCLLFGGILVICLEMGLSILRPGASGSLTRHAALWAGCFGILAAGTLLVRFLPSAGKAWSRAEDRLMNPETRKPWIDAVLAVAAGAMLLHHLYVLLYYPVIPAGASKLTPVWIVLAAATAVLGRSWRDWGTRLGALLLVFMFERTYLKNLNITGREIVYFSAGIYSVFICYGAFSAIRPPLRRKLLAAVCFIGTSGILVLCGAGLYTAWTGVSVFNLAKEPVQVVVGRLQLFSNADISGGWTGAGIALALMGFALHKNKVLKAWYLLISFVFFLTTSLTGSRSAFMMEAFLISGMICLGIRRCFARHEGDKPEGKPEGKKKAAMLLAVLLSFMICFVISVECSRQLTGVFIRIRDRGGLIAAAQAEEISGEQDAALPEFVQRETIPSSKSGLNDILGGRLGIWSYAWNYTLKHPGIFLYGLSVDGSTNYAEWRLDHAHNILIQIFLEGGVPALLLFLGLLAYFFLHACRLWKRGNLPLWQQLLPVPVLAILLQEMAECLTHFSFGHPPMTVFYFFMGCTVAVSKTILAEEAGKKSGGSLPRDITGG